VGAIDDFSITLNLQIVHSLAVLMDKRPWPCGISLMERQSDTQIIPSYLHQLHK
jgi:hypothetical protein